MLDSLETLFREMRHTVVANEPLEYDIPGTEPGDLARSVGDRLGRELRTMRSLICEVMPAQDAAYTATSGMPVTAGNVASSSTTSRCMHKC